MVNFGRQWTDRLHLGVELDLREASVEEDVTDIELGVDSKVAASDFAIGPVARWYGEAVGPVLPFLRARALVGWGDQTFEQAGQEQYTDDSFRVAGSLAIGAEWQFSRFARLDFGLRTTRWFGAGNFRSIANDVLGAGEIDVLDGDFTTDGYYLRLTVVPR